MMVSAGFGEVRPNGNFFIISGHLGWGHGRNKWLRVAQPGEVGTAGRNTCPPCSRLQEVVAEQAVAHSCSAAHSMFELPDVQGECSKVRQADPIRILHLAPPPPCSLLCPILSPKPQLLAPPRPEIILFYSSLLSGCHLSPIFSSNPRLQPAPPAFYPASFTAESAGPVLNSAHCTQQTQVSSNFFFGGPSSRAQGHESRPCGELDKIWKDLWELKQHITSDMKCAWEAR